jgi:hypothetical protein
MFAHIWCHLFKYKCQFVCLIMFCSNYYAFTSMGFPYLCCVYNSVMLHVYLCYEYVHNHALLSVVL